MLTAVKHHRRRAEPDGGTAEEQGLIQPSSTFLTWLTRTKRFHQGPQQQMLDDMARERHHQASMMEWRARAQQLGEAKTENLPLLLFLLKHGVRHSSSLTSTKSSNRRQSQLVNDSRVPRPQFTSSIHSSFYSDPALNEGGRIDCVHSKKEMNN